MGRRALILPLVVFLSVGVTAVPLVVGGHNSSNDVQSSNVTGHSEGGLSRNRIKSFVGVNVTTDGNATGGYARLPSFNAAVDNTTGSNTTYDQSGNGNHHDGNGSNITIAVHGLVDAGNRSSLNRTSPSWDGNHTDRHYVANNTDLLWQNFTLDNSSDSADGVRVGRHLENSEVAVNATVVCPEVVNRTVWGGRRPLMVEKLLVPVRFVVIHHTYIPAACNESSDCCAKMQQMQRFHMGKGWNDIGYNFLIGGDNKVYAGRGWGVVGAHSPKYNFVSIGISFIGDYRTSLPTPSMLELAQSLITCGVSLGNVKPDYRLVGHRQVRDTECPGDALYSEIQGWPQWEDFTDIVPRKENVTNGL